MIARVIGWPCLDQSACRRVYHRSTQSKASIPASSIGIWAGRPRIGVDVNDGVA